ncbi:Stealth CR1 domain-containing protein [Neptunicella sp. SCSIO 80796]|uniref:Stealth CR1 domain-containing protein n=1 Tax=Neptunicella plasticusilytica TaxID=3117012 RepID=UPI003A4D72C4
MSEFVDPIDIVITWVDGNDPAWLAEKAKYTTPHVIMNGTDRYRDWDNLQYLFRGIEKFMPWVNHIFFVTWGHLPAWLNTHHDKITIVKHEDFLDKQHLPVFNVNPIEINFHKIKGLSEQFIYFNDDCFVLQPLQQTHFFRQGLPVNAAISNIMHEGVIAPIVLNDLELINKNFNRHKGDRLTKRGIIGKNWWKWFYPGYGLKILDTLLLLRWKTFSGFVNYHQPQPYLKQTYQNVWEKEPEALLQTSASRFRAPTDVNQYLFRYWQFVSGQFYPDSVKNAFKRRRYVELRSVGNVENAAKEIESGNYQMYCLNDSMSKGRFTERDVTPQEFEQSKKRIQQALHKLLPNRSKFEKI